MNTTAIMIVGVGGQGTLLASKLLGRMMLDQGMEVKVSEVHGMSQRGGSVVTYVKFGDKVYSPIIAEGEADYIISFEKIEAARYLNCLKKHGRIIVNDREMYPMPVIIGDKKYPHDVLKEIEDKGVQIDAFDASTLAEESGMPKCANIILMGRLSKYMDIPEECWLNALKSLLNDKLYAMNEKAFRLGRG